MAQSQQKVPTASTYRQRIVMRSYYQPHDVARKFTGERRPPEQDRTKLIKPRGSNVFYTNLRGKVISH